MRNIKLTVEYDGTKFNGWQIQPNGNRTVQGKIESALLKIFKKPIRVIGSGRTDTGVHAVGQAANFKVHTKMDTDEICRALNGNLPDDISITESEDRSSKFHSQYTARSKIYRYSILNRPTRSPQFRNTALYYPYKLNLKAMREEAKALIGRKDFKAFCAADASKKERNTIRTIKGLEIRKKGPLILIDVEANGFLYKMVRNIVGTLLEIGRGQLPKGSVAKILKSKNRAKAGDTAKAHGLCLLEVKY